MVSIGEKRRLVEHERERRQRLFCLFVCLFCLRGIEWRFLGCLGGRISWGKCLDVDVDVDEQYDKITFCIAFCVLCFLFCGVFYLFY
jgi:hypothetical protein